MADINEPSRTSPDARAGVVAALVAYTTWGFQPLLFHALEHVGAPLVVAHRTVWALIVVGLVLMVSRQFGQVMTIVRNGKALRTLALSSLLLCGNWLLYVWAVETGQVLEASFGYFINPLVNIAIGMIFLGERQNRWQAVSIGIAVVAIAIQALGVGGVPYIALSLALSFGAYGYIRKTAPVPAAPGLLVESALLLPLALAYLGYVLMTEGPGVQADPMTLLLLMGTGPVTALPLTLFAFAVQRLRLTTIGMFQYIAPSLLFVLAITFFAEPLNPVRLLSFVLIWISLGVFTLDAVWCRKKV